MMTIKTLRFGRDRAGTSRAVQLFLALAVLVFAGCGEGGTPTATAADAGARGAVGAVPQPGDEADDWRVFGAADVGSPEAAWPVGLATAASPYVEAIVSRETGQAFFVFRAGLEEIQLVLQAPPGQPFVESVRLFAVADGQRGDELTPSWSVPHGGTWAVIEGETYLVEITGPRGAFF